LRRKGDMRGAQENLNLHNESKNCTIYFCCNFVKLRYLDNFRHARTPARRYTYRDSEEL